MLNKCFGHDKETRECICNYKIEGWSCWSNFGPCTANCGKGIQKRTRICLGNQISCLGQSEEIQTCFGSNCSFYGILLFKRNFKINNYWKYKIIDGLTTSFHNNYANGFNLSHIIIISILAFLLGSSSVLSNKDF